MTIRMPFNQRFTHRHDPPLLRGDASFARSIRLTLKAYQRVVRFIRRAQCAFAQTVWGNRIMFRAIGNAFWYVVTTPARIFRWCVACISAFQLFLDRRRNHICVAIVAIMMAVVGIQLRHAGYADLRPGEYVALSVNDREAAENPTVEQPSKPSLREAIRDSLRDFRSKIPSLRGDDEPVIETREREEPPALTIPPTTASRQRSIAPTAPSLNIPPQPPRLEVKQVSAQKSQTLVMPEPKVIDLSELEEPEVDVASLSGIIETEDDHSHSMFDDE